MSDKKKEEKYCQENFDLNNKDERNRLIALCVIVGVLVFGIFYYLFSTRKYNRIIKNAKDNYPDVLKTCLDRMNIFEVDKIPEKTLKCSCYYRKDETIIDCTNSKNVIPEKIV
jgi:hypothetical protein